MGTLGTHTVALDGSVTNHSSAPPGQAGWRRSAGRVFGPVAPTRDAVEAALIAGPMSLATCAWFAGAGLVEVGVIAARPGAGSPPLKPLELEHEAVCSLAVGSAIEQGSPSAGLGAMASTDAASMCHLLVPVGLAGDGPELGLHLGMAGHISIDEEPHPRWDRFALEFEGGGRLALRDRRRLGRAMVMPDFSHVGTRCRGGLARGVPRADRARAARRSRRGCSTRRAIAGVGQPAGRRDPLAGADRTAPADRRASTEELDGLRRVTRRVIRKAIRRRGRPHRRAHPAPRGARALPPLRPALERARSAAARPTGARGIRGAWKGRLRTCPRELLRRPRHAARRRPRIRDLPPRRAAGQVRRRPPALLAEGPAREPAAQRGRRRRHAPSDIEALAELGRRRPSPSREIAFTPGARAAAGLHRRARGRRPGRDARRDGATWAATRRRSTRCVPVELVIDHSVQVDEFGTPRRVPAQRRARVRAQPASATPSCAGARARSTTSRSCRPTPASATRSTSSTSPAWCSSTTTTRTGLPRHAGRHRLAHHDDQRPRRARLGRRRHRGRGGDARPAGLDADPAGGRLQARRASCPRARPPPTWC